MAVGLYFSSVMSAAQYDETIKKLEQAGAGAPKGRTYHAAFLEGDKISVFDVWDSQAEFDAFGETLELAVRDIVHGRTVKNIESLANPEALDEFKNRIELKD